MERLRGGLRPEDPVSSKRLYYRGSVTSAAVLLLAVAGSTIFSIDPLTMKTFLLNLCLCTVAAHGAGTGPAASAQRFDEATPLEWSRRMADSEMHRRGQSLFFGGAPRARWDYTTSLFGLSLLRLAERVGETKYAEYGAKTAESFIKNDGSIETYQLGDFNLDMIPAGKVLLFRYEHGQRDPRNTKALATLREQLRKQPRTPDGGYWHKLRYPDQMWLDGLFMSAPFLAQYGKLFEEPVAFDEVAKQILLMDRHAYDSKTGLYFHAWDAKRAQPWANPETGQSPNFWGRAVGWYAMSLVDSLDYLPPTHPDVEKIGEVLRRLADGVVKWQDPDSGLWWQVLDQGSREGNYLEATASSMFVYSLAKAVNRGYLPRDTYLPAVIKGYDGLIKRLIKRDSNGAVSLTQCCEVAGLGYTTAKGRPRDGTFAYYVSEPVIENDLKGVGPFILAGIEVQQLLTAPPAQRIVRGWSDYESVAARIKAPTFAPADFSIVDFGAKPGENVTAAIRSAIAACHKAGGGRVVIPPGEWLTGAIELKSNVNLHVSEGARLRWSFDLAQYPLVFTRWEGVECMNYSAFIYAYEQENIAVTGSGMLDGGANFETWWSWNNKNEASKKQKSDRDQLIAWGESNHPVDQRIFGSGHFLRPNFIQPYRCRNILIEGVSIVRSPMWEINPVLSQNITVRGIKIASHGPNNDGCDPESCSDVLIEDCIFDTGDDCIAIKSGRNGDGRRVNVPTENVIIRKCQMKDGHGGVVLGSECTGGIRNVFVEDCEMDSPQLDRALRFKNNAVRGGVLENVFMRNVTIGHVSEAVLTIDLLYEEGAKGAFQPVVRNVQLEHITSSASPRVLYIRGFEKAVVDNIRISHSTFAGVTDAEVISHAGSIVFDHVTILPAKSAKSLNSVLPTK